MPDRSQIDEWLNQWLRDAHAMEKQAEQMLTAQSSRIENYPDLAARIERHLHETQSQIGRLETCMEMRGISRSMTKDMGGQFAAMMQGFGGMFAGDEVVKGAMASYAFENMEIATYRILSAAAREAGDVDTARVCDEICREEEAMAGFLEERLPEITRMYLTRVVVDSDNAKR